MRTRPLTDRAGAGEGRDRRRPERVSDLAEDRFGNLTTNISASLLKQHFGKDPKLVIKIGTKRISGLVDHYSQIKLEELGAIINSWDALEVFCREDDAAQRLNKGPGDRVLVTRSQ